MSNAITKVSDKLVTADTLKGLSESGVRYACMMLIEDGFSSEFDSASEDPSHPLHGISQDDFYRSQCDVIDTWSEAIADAEVSIDSEMTEALTLLIEIVNTFVQSWEGAISQETGEPLTLETVIDVVGSADDVLSEMVLSAFHHGAGLWEHIGNFGNYPGYIDGVENYDLMCRIRAKYLEFGWLEIPAIEAESA